MLAGLIDLTGNVFGKLTVVRMSNKTNKSGEKYWVCKCECGTVKDICGSSLRRKNGTDNCGCSRVKDISGKKFGKLTAIKLIPSKRKGALWECKCECGNTTEVMAGDLRSGYTKSCGCGKAADLKGLTFGRLTVLKRNELKTKVVEWDCVCECGNTTTVRASKLKNGHTKSCGCYRLEKIREAKCKKNKKIDNGECFVVFDDSGNSFLLDYNCEYILDDRYWLLSPIGYFIDKDKIYLHRELTNASNEYVVDHINGNKKDNRFTNLRKVKNIKNSWNRKEDKRSATGVLGVTLEKSGKYSAYITTNKKKTSLGRFSNLKDAINARMNAELEQRGELSYFWKENGYCQD